MNFLASQKTNFDIGNVMMYSVDTNMFCLFLMIMSIKNFRYDSLIINSLVVFIPMKNSILRQGKNLL